MSAGERTRKGRRRRRLVPALAAAALLLAACSSPSGRHDDGDLRGFYDQEIAWKTCAGHPTVECGRLEVPLDYAEPARGTVDVAVYRAPARRTEAAGTVVVLPGDAGQSAADLLRPGVFAFDELRASQDVVTYDPRGAGSTLPLECESEQERAARTSLDATPDTPGEERSLVAAWKAYAESCGRASGDALRLVGTRETARDLDVLRGALGLKTVTLHAMSYGTLTASEYARVFPDRVRRLVLDAPRTAGTLTDGQALAGMVEATERTFDLALATCFDNPFLACPLGSTPAAARTRAEALLAELDDAPVDLGDAGLLSRERAVGALWEAMAEGEQGWQAATRWLAAAAVGDWAELAEHAPAAARGPSPDGPTAIRCTDFGPPDVHLDEVRSRAREQGERFPVFGETVAWWSIRCAGWPVGPTLESKVRTPLAPAGDALVVASQGDPLTPQGFTTATADLLGGAPVLTYTGATHLAYVGSDCVRYVVNGFLVHGILPRVLTCGDVPTRTGRGASPCTPPCSVIPARAEGRPASTAASAASASG